MGIIAKVAADAGFNMQKYNDNHGPDGKFTSGGGAGEATQQTIEHPVTYTYRDSAGNAQSGQIGAKYKATVRSGRVVSAVTPEMSEIQSSVQGRNIGSVVHPSLDDLTSKLKSDTGANPHSVGDKVINNGQEKMVTGTTTSSAGHFVQLNGSQWRHISEVSKK